MKYTQIMMAIALYGWQTESAALIQPKPALSLATSYSSSLGIEISDYWYSEKLDGIRAYWTGTKLLTRRGKEIHAPRWFTDALPNLPLDGELWAGRGGFHKVQLTVLDSIPSDDAWRGIHFMVFDLPAENESFKMRYQTLVDVIGKMQIAHVQYVTQHAINDENHLREILEDITHENGEGVMLRHKERDYRAGRGTDLIKLKVHQDAEAIVIGHNPGKGKYRGQTGSLRVINNDGIEFNIGSGLSDIDRVSPPSVGAIVTYRYSGTTHNQIPRFVRYVRERTDD